MDANQGSRAAAGVYGRSLGEKYGAEDAPSVVARSLHCAELAVTEIYVDQPLGRLSDPLPRVDAYMVSLMVSDLPSNMYFEDGRQVSAYSLQAGAVTIHDLKREPVALMDKPFHSLLWYLPRTALDALADQASVPRISELRYQPGVGVFDETIKHIGLSLMPALQTPDRVSRLFADHVNLAFAAHAAHNLRRNADRRETAQGWARSLAGKTIEGNDCRRPFRRDATAGDGRGLRTIGQPFLASVPQIDRPCSSCLAAPCPRRSRQGSASQTRRATVHDRRFLRLR
jgi:hypothetical protein